MLLRRPLVTQSANLTPKSGGAGDTPLLFAASRGQLGAVAVLAKVCENLMLFLRNLILSRASCSSIQKG